MELARVFAARPSIVLHLSLSRQSELFAATNSIGLPSFHVDTYRNPSDFLLRTPMLPVIGRQFRSYIERQRIDVVFNTMDFLWGSWLSPTIARTKALYLLAVHDAQRHPGEDSLLRRWLLKRDIAIADGAITLTEAVREQLLKIHYFPPERAWTAPLGVTLEAEIGQPRRLPTGRPIRLLFFGRILPYKGLEVMLEAMPLIRGERPDVELEIWGSGDIAPYRSALKRTEGVRLEHRWLDETEIRAVFERADICVLPYREASQSGVIPLAFATGMPIVTTPLPSLIEQINHGRAGIVASDFSPRAFANAVLSLIGEPETYHALSRQAIAHSLDCLSWSKIGDKIEEAILVLRTLGPRRSPRSAMAGSAQ
jgi:glycosyltransferase involved in cell wall biosynthesis